MIAGTRLVKADGCSVFRIHTFTDRQQKRAVLRSALLSRDSHLAQDCSLAFEATRPSAGPGLGCGRPTRSVIQQLKPPRGWGGSPTGPTPGPPLDGTPPRGPL